MPYLELSFQPCFVVHHCICRDNHSPSSHYPTRHYPSGTIGCCANLLLTMELAVLCWRLQDLLLWFETDPSSSTVCLNHAVFSKDMKKKDLNLNMSKYVDKLHVVLKLKHSHRFKCFFWKVSNVCNIKTA